MNIKLPQNSQLSEWKDKYGPTALLLLLLFILWKVRGFFSFFGSLADTTAAAAAGATASVNVASQQAQDKAVVKKVNPAATTAQVDKYRQDVETIAAALGKLPGSWSNSLVADSAGAMAVAKQYSCFMFRSEGGGIKYIDKRKTTGALVLTTQKQFGLKRAASLNLNVLSDLYKNITGNRSLISDLNSAFTGVGNGDYTHFWTNFVKPQ